MAELIDTNVLVYRVDARFPGKQGQAQELLDRLVTSDQCRIPHQALVEFYEVATRVLRDIGQPLLNSTEARAEVEMLLLTCTVLYPVEGVLRLALHCKDAYGLNWCDAHLLAHAEYYGCSILYSEDYHDGRYYGTVRVVNPFT
ncbi:MAG TPA: PIN domain-containing protein [Chthoniobacterales bacterium]